MVTKKLWIFTLRGIYAGFKEFDVLKYIEVFTGLEQAQNDDELKAAKAAFENFENEIYGFEEKREELKAEDKTANPEKKRKLRSFNQSC